MKLPSLFSISPGLLALAFFSTSALSGEKGELVFEESFDGTELAQGWAAQFGDWKPVDGVLVAKQVAADNHAAAARRRLPMQDGIYEMRFRLTGEGQAFHFGFDPAPGELDKKGHLFSVIVTPKMAKLMKHVDKNRREEDPNEDLAKAVADFSRGTWFSLSLEKKGNEVSAVLTSEDGKSTSRLSASHPTFHVKTPTLVFRCVGDGIEVDDIKVWKLADAK